MGCKRGEGAPSQVHPAGTPQGGSGSEFEAGEPNGFFGYTLSVELILKLVAGLVSGIREYFVFLVTAICIPVILILALVIIGRGIRRKKESQK